MTAYFYCCSTPLDVGSVVRPGDWARILRAYNHQIFSDTWIALVGELVYEIVRRELFPTKPSRFHCLFLCTSEVGLLDFRAASGRTRDIGYEVELINPQAQSHLGDWTLPNVRSTYDVTAIARHALLYWRGISVANPQLVTLSPIRIARRLQRRTRWRLRRRRPMIADLRSAANPTALAGTDSPRQPPPTQPALAGPAPCRRGVCPAGQPPLWIGR
jgi:Protein of unknown function (DUF2441)